MTPCFKRLFEALKERAESHGEEIKVNFVKQCLKRVNPKVMTIMNIANDTEWKFLPKPDDAPAKGSPDEPQFIAATKDRYYKQWLERVNKGEFDGRPPMHIGEDAPEEKSEEVDMAALARAEKEKAKASPPVTMINEPEDDRSRYEQEEEEERRKSVDKEVDQFCKELPDKVELPTLKKLNEPPSLEHWDKLGPAANLLHALNEFVASTESPPEDKPSVDLSEVLERLDKLEKKQKSLFNAMRDL